MPEKSGIVTFPKIGAIGYVKKTIKFNLISKQTRRKFDP